MRKLSHSRPLFKRIALWTLAASLVYTLAFMAAAWMFDRSVSSMLGEAVANVVSPWTYMAATDDSVEAVESSSTIKQVKADIVRNYLNRLADATVPDADSALELPDVPYDGSGLTVLSSGLSEEDVRNGLKGWSLSDAVEASKEAPDVLEIVTSTDILARDAAGDTITLAQYEAALTARARTESFAEAQAQGLFLSQDYAAAFPDDTAQENQQWRTTLYGIAPSQVSDTAKRMVCLALDLRNAGASCSLEDAIWTMTKEWYANDDLVDALYEEARAAMSADYSRMVVFQSGSVYEERIVFGDGHTEYRNLEAYNAVKELKLPVLAFLYGAGFFILALAAARKGLGYFDLLFDSLRSLLAKEGPRAPLPDELSFAQKAVDEIDRENELEKQAAELAEKRKNELVAYLAHDTKTPLTTITGFLSLLDEAPDLPAEQRARYVRTALDKARRLDGMLDEFFEIARYNLHAIPLEREWLDPALLCCQVADEFFPKASERDITIKVTADEGDRAFVDGAKLSRALSNVVKNAVAYADQHTAIEVSAEIVEAWPAAEDDEELVDVLFGRTLRIAVTNQGKEISPEHLDRIFDKFYREDAARATAQGGAGLGLAIAREIVTAHGGTIEAESKHGATVFTLILPAEPSA